LLDQPQRVSRGACVSRGPWEFARTPRTPQAAALLARIARRDGAAPSPRKQTAARCPASAAASALWNLLVPAGRPAMVSGIRVLVAKRVRITSTRLSCILSRFSSRIGKRPGAKTTHTLKEPKTQNRRRHAPYDVDLEQPQGDAWVWSAGFAPEGPGQTNVKTTIRRPAPPSESQPAESQGAAGPSEGQYRGAEDSLPRHGHLYAMRRSRVLVALDARPPRGAGL